MERMGILEEWLKSIVAENTKKHHKRALSRFVEFMKESPETLLEERRAQFGKSKLIETRVIEFYQWLQKKKGLSQNSARSEVIGVQSFFSYYSVPLQLRGKLPNTHMKLDAEKLTAEDLRNLYKYNDLSIKTWIAFSRDCPARIGDLLEVRRKQIKSEFLLKSEKENVVGKVFLSNETIDLFKRYWTTVPESEYAFSSPTGYKYDQTTINRTLKAATKKAGIDKKITQHSLRKLWITSAINLGLPEIVYKILSFKSVSPDMLTYFLDREDLGNYWKKVTDFLSLEPTANANARVGNLEEDMQLLARALMKLIEQERGRPFGAMLGMLAKGEVSEREYLEQFLKEEWGKKKREE